MGSRLGGNNRVMSLLRKQESKKLNKRAVVSGEDDAIYLVLSVIIPISTLSDGIVSAADSVEKRPRSYSLK